MTPVKLEPATLQSRAKESTTEPLGARLLHVFIYVSDYIFSWKQALDPNQTGQMLVFFTHLRHISGLTTTQSDSGSLIGGLWVAKGPMFLQQKIKTDLTD